MPGTPRPPLVLPSVCTRQLIFVGSHEQWDPYQCPGECGGGGGGDKLLHTEVSNNIA